ncbi:unnamed protein product [Rangifer tarandus platyrhynchus]|uniref:Uncharacterized protein n=1 Tax=Rangifer tarandus platyrhynchus TaxID=3082113 RepID=A0ABN8YWT7_RANTA|nr:unnamed protein product [Rangifer tarandus platyrhynchus]
MSAKSLEWCLTLCDPVDCSLPGSSVHGILQARILEGVATSSSRGIFPIQGSNVHLSPAVEDRFLTTSATSFPPALQEISHSQFLSSSQAAPSLVQGQSQERGALRLHTLPRLALGTHRAQWSRLP